MNRTGRHAAMRVGDHRVADDELGVGRQDLRHLARLGGAFRPRRQGGDAVGDRVEGLERTKHSVGDLGGDSFHQLARGTCGDVVREVSFADRSLQYCATCQTGGTPLADRRTSKFLK